MKKLLSVFLLLVSGTLHAQQWISIVPQDRPITVVASGIVTSADALRFGPPPSRSWRTTITQLAREGSRVSEGDVLVQFDASATDDRVRTLSGELNAKRSELESLLENQANEIEQGKVRLAEAESLANKAARKTEADADLFASLEYQKLLEEKAVTAEVLAFEKERVKLVERVRVSKQAELEAEIRRLESELTGAQKELESFTIRAPRAGLVIVGTDREGKKLDVNESVNPGLVVVELANENNLVVHADIPEFAAARITVGQSAEISIEAAGGGELAGEVISVGKIVRRQSQYSQAMVRDVTVSLPTEAFAELKPGMSVKLLLAVDTRREVLAVPDESIQYRDGKPGVVVRGDGWRPVLLGPASAGTHIIEKGIEPFEEVML